MYVKINLKKTRCTFTYKRISILGKYRFFLASGNQLIAMPLLDAIHNLMTRKLNTVNLAR